MVVAELLKPGTLASVQMTSVEMELFKKMIGESKAYGSGRLLDFLEAYLGDRGLIEFLDILAGMSIKIPDRNAVLRDLESVKIYNCWDRNGGDVEALQTVSKLYNKTPTVCKAAINKVSKYVNPDFVSL